ncbi:hypothetical protein [Cupriavidus sp. TMH.W2]|uniref:hypothetical protein n=1 Tax=Cupriavidus sp. TMH.W2 TaxID=3434465 RepID=UPI003D78B228
MTASATLPAPTPPTLATMALLRAALALTRYAAAPFCSPGRRVALDPEDPANTERLQPTTEDWWTGLRERIEALQPQLQLALATAEAGAGPAPLATETGVGPWCAPGPAATQVPGWLLRFEDVDRGDVTFDDEDAARRAFARAEGQGYNAHLLTHAPRDATPTMPAADWRALLAAVLRELAQERADRHSPHHPGNAPGHAHARPGIWDADNGVLAGQPCAWCTTWSAARRALGEEDGSRQASRPGVTLARPAEAA